MPLSFLFHPTRPPHLRPPCTPPAPPPKKMSAHFYTVLKLRESVKQELSNRLSERNEKFTDETYAAVSIERVHRGAMVRSWKTGMIAASVQVQRVFRGYVGRNKAIAANTQRIKDARLGFFHYQASIVQKSFRGYYSRRYYHDFFARKAYIQEVIVKSEKLRAELSNHRQELLERDAREQEDKAREEFSRVTENLHHLLSTKCQPGIYNSPYLQGDVPTAFNIPVEDHLRIGAATQLKKRQMNTRGSSRSMSTAGSMRGGMRGSTAGSTGTNGSTSGGANFRARPRSRISVQAEGKYGEDIEARRIENKYARLQRLDPKPFSAGSKTRLKTNGPGISQGTPYEALWKVARSSRDPALEDKTKRVSDQPFVSAMKKGGRAFDDHADESWYREFKQMEQASRTVTR